MATSRPSESAPCRVVPTPLPCRLHVCYVSQDYPPGVVAGIARMTHELATGLAAAGHVVRVISRGASHTVAVLHELARIEGLRPIDLVQAPNWDCEGLATLLDGRGPFVLGVYTPMTAALRHNPVWCNDPGMLRDVIRPIIAGERACYSMAPALLACGPAISGR